MKDNIQKLGFLFGLLSNVLMSITFVLSIINLVFIYTSQEFISWSLLLLLFGIGIVFFIVALILMFKNYA